MGLNFNITAGIAGAYTDTDEVGGAVVDTLSQRSILNFVTGVTAGKCNLLYVHAINLSASASEALTLTALLDPIGQNCDFVRIKAILVFADSGNTNDINLGGAASNQFVGPAGATGVVHTRPGGVSLLVAHDATGWVVVASTGDQLKLANSSSGTAVTGKLIILGANA